MTAVETAGIFLGERQGQAFGNGTAGKKRGRKVSAGAVTFRPNRAGESATIQFQAARGDFHQVAEQAHKFL
jgi:hypothetical protein